MLKRLSNIKTKVAHPREEVSLTTITNSKEERIPKAKVNQGIIDMFDQYVRIINSISKNRCELAGLFETKNLDKPQRISTLI